MADITLSLDDTLELDEIIKEWSRTDSNLNLNGDESSFDISGLQTKTSILNPQEPGKYTITINGQDLSVEVTDPSTIPDSAVLHYPIRERTDPTVVEVLQGADATANGTTNISGGWYDGYAESGDGSGDYIRSTDWGSFGSGMDSGWAISFTVQTSSTGTVLGTAAGGVDDPRFFVAFTNHFDPNNNPNRLQVTARRVGRTAAYSVETTADLNDGAKHRVVVQGSGVTASEMEIYVDSEADYQTIRNDATFGSYADFANPVDFLDSTDNVSLGGLAGDIDNLIAYGSPLSTSEIQDDYDNQPWT